MMEVNFPDDIIINEILLRLPVHSLLRFKWVCKSWFNLITHPDFVKKHFLHSTRDDHQIMKKTLVLTTDGNVLYSRKYKDMYHTSSSSALNKTAAFMATINHPFGSRFEILGSCKGLVYLRAPKGLFSLEYNYFILNPSTTEFKKLPNYGRKYSKDEFRKYSIVHGFGYDHTINDYKVLKIYHIDRPSNDNVSILSRINIYTLGSDSWSTKIEDTNPVLQARHYIRRPGTKSYSGPNRGVLVNGSLHWLMKAYRFLSILCFDIVNEEHRQIQLPPITDNAPVLAQSTSLEVLNECLCISRVDIASHNTELWMMKDYGAEESWTKLFTIKGKSLLKEISQLGNGRPWEYHMQLLKCHFEVLKYYSEDGGILMLCNSKYLITYYPANNKSTIEKTRTEVGKIEIYGSYIESLVSVNSGLYLTDAGPTKTIPYIQGTKREVKSKIQNLKRVWRFGVLGQALYS